MKRIILIENLFIIFISVLIVWIITAFLYQNLLINEKGKELRSTLNLISSLPTSTQADVIKSNFKSNRINIQIIDKNRTSEAPEVKTASENGYGENARNYGIFGVSDISAAIKLKNGTILHANSEVPQGSYSFWSVIPALILGALLSLRQVSKLVFGIRFLLKGAEMTIERAGNEAGVEVKPAPELLEYTEFIESAEELAKTSTAISQKVKELYVENKRIDYLLNNMNEGLVVLGRDLNILVINRSAEKYFDAGLNLKGSNILRLTHNPSIEKTLKTVFESGNSGAVDVKSPDGKKILQIMISAILDDDSHEINGAIMLISDVTEIRLAEQIRSEFVANASHELKTPLTTIKGFSELIDTGIVSDPEKARGYLLHIRTETERMIGLINDILKLSELEATSHDTGLEQVSLKFLAQKVKSSLVNQITEKNIEVNVEGDIGSFDANPDHMQQMLLNLIDNAIKYNREGGEVIIIVTQSPGEVGVMVKDTGVGIPKESQKRVFERFYRVDKSRSRKMGGTGLGLSIVKHIVELYNGTIKLESEQGKGTSISIMFPLDDKRV